MACIKKRQESTVDGSVGCVCVGECFMFVWGHLIVID